MTKREIRLDPELNLYATLAKAKKIAARAAKKGLSGGYTVSTETRVETITTTGKTTENTYLIIEGSPAKYNGWTFVALVEWVNGQAVVTSTNYTGPQVDRSTLVQGACDHCAVNRNRTAVVVVEDESGVRKQVGKQCLKDYLGQESPLTWFSKKDPFEEFEGYSGYGVAYSGLFQALTAAASVVRQKGWVRSGSFSQTPTKELVELVLGSQPSNKLSAELWTELREGFKTEEDEATARDAFEFAQQLQGETDYVQNVKAVISTGIDGAFNPKYLGLVVSIIGVYQKELIKRAEQAADPVVDEPYGQVGDKVTVTVTSTGGTGFETAYGYTFVNTFTGAGYRFKWLTGTRSFEAGQTLTLKGTIKGYDEWNGKTFTLLTRCKEIAA
jgi:hypothetical protein